jgi:hypothetical protein
MAPIKPQKSKVLAAIIADWSKPPPPLPKSFVKALGTYPHNRRTPLFCWLWDNHEEVTQMRRRWLVTWDGIATIIAEDGIKGRHGNDPTADAVRKVWKRVCRDIEAKPKP